RPRVIRSAAGWRKYGGWTPTDGGPKLDHVPQRSFERRLTDRADLPSVDVPDWGLFERLAEFVAPLQKDLILPSFGVVATDARGTYEDEGIDALRDEASDRGA